MRTDQLVQVVLDPWKVGERTDGHQAAQSKVKQLVAEKRDEPAVAMLREAGEDSQVMNTLLHWADPICVQAQCCLFKQLHPHTQLSLTVSSK